MDESGGVIGSFAVSANNFIEKEIDITGFDKICFGANAQKAGNNGTAKFFDPIAE